MKITSIDIKGFGKFSQLKITPSLGFNMIYADNEAGKSTLQAFIRAMLYGQRGGRKSKDGSLPPLKQYKPWNADQYSGVMEYTLDNGDFYRVGRNFDKGTANIYDKGANNVTSQYAQDKEIGPKYAEEHLGIDESTFERSAFIHQLECAIDDDGRKSLVEKLSNLSSTGSEELSLTQAVNTLDSALLERVGTGRSTTRPLDKVNIRLLELEQKKKELEELNERYLDTARSLHEKKSLQKELTKSFEQKRQQKAGKRYEKLRGLRKELENLSEESNHIEDELTKCTKTIQELKLYEDVTVESVSKAILLLHDGEREKEAIESETIRLLDLQNRCENLKESLDPEDLFQKRMKTMGGALENYRFSKETAAQKNRVPAKKSTPVKSSWVGTIIFIFAVAALILMGYYIKNQSPVALGIGILIIAVFGIILSYVNVKKAYRQSHIHTDADVLNEALHEAGFSSMTDYIQYRESQLKSRENFENMIKEIRESQIRINLLKGKVNNQTEELNHILGDVGENYKQVSRTAAVESLKQGMEYLGKAKEYQRILISKRATINDKFKMVLRDAGTIMGKTFLTFDDFKETFSVVEIREIVSADDYSEQQLDRELEMTEQRINQVKLEIATLNTRLEQGPLEGELTNVCEEMSLLQVKKEKLEMMGSSLTLAKEILNDTALKLQHDYVPALNEEMSNMMSCLTSGRYEILRTNDKLQVNLEVPETDELISVSRLSGGTIDQVYFCMRLAAVLLIEKGRERLPLFLDEPFSQYDETRVLRAFELLKEISRERQIFFFTCRARELELAQAVFGEEMNKIRF